MNKNIQSNLSKLKNEINNEAIPNQFEHIINNVIDSKMKKKIIKFNFSRARIILTSFILVFIMLFSYSFDTVAFYGKKFTGYENIEYGPIDVLIESGKGQIIDKSVTFEDGNVFTLEGVIFNENHFYMLVNTYNEESIWNNPNPYNIELKGLMSYYSYSGTGKIVDDHNEKGILTFEVPKFYEKWMKLIITDYKTREQKTINFTLRRNDAYVDTVKKSISKEFTGSNYRVKFSKINVSYEEIYVEGEITFTSKDDYNRILDYDYRPSFHFDLYLNDKLVKPSTFRGGGNTRGINKEITIDFKLSYYNPGEATKIEIKNIVFGSGQEINKEVVINLGYTTNPSLPNPKLNGISINEPSQNIKLTDDVKIENLSQNNELTKLEILSKKETLFYLYKGTNRQDILDYTISKEVIDGNYLYTITYKSPDDVVRLYIEEDGYYKQLENNFIVIDENNKE